MNPQTSQELIEMVLSGQPYEIWLPDTSYQAAVAMLDILESKDMWEAAKLRFPAGRVVSGTVLSHHPFGIFVDLGDPVTRGLVHIPEFLDDGRMTMEQYPAVGVTVTAVVLGHSDAGDKEVWLSMKPSLLSSRDS